MQISRYAAARAADHGVAFPDQLRIPRLTRASYNTPKLCLLSSKTNRTVQKWFEAHVQRYSS